jgi:peptidoglycan hydrolase-like protein with peptidoglycan-binding domain
MKRLQKTFRRIWEEIGAFVAIIRQRVRRKSRVKTGTTIRASITSAKAGVPRGASYHTSVKKPGVKVVLQKLNKRSIKMTAAAAAVVVAAVVLGVTLGGKGAQATGADDTPVKEAAAQSTDPETTVPAEASPTITQATPVLSDPFSTPIATTAPEVAEMIPGCHDTRIIEVQEKLMELGYLGNDEPTDYYGSGTKYALQLFQRSHSLQVDGLLGEKTMTALFSGDAMPYTVRLGDRGTDIKSMQERLKELKYFSGEATGEFGVRTETAVKNFQKRNGLSPDGIVGENTIEALFSESARPASGSSGGGGGSSGGSSGSHGGGTTIATWEPDSAKVEALIDFAKTMLGREYVKGGKGPDVFDCSGLVYYCLNNSGYRIGYMTSGGWANCSLPKVTKMSDMRRGDIICFKGHVGIYLGNGQMIDASSTQDEVRICTNVLTSAYWKKNFICARRLF